VQWITADDADDDVVMLSLMLVVHLRACGCSYMTAPKDGFLYLCLYVLLGGAGKHASCVCTT
jgi:hypothetical protein